MESEHGSAKSGVLRRDRLDYVSCSSFRVAIARLAPAHAALEGGAGERDR
jgi:hypothetical protein